jgi:hypothetical protein
MQIKPTVRYSSTPTRMASIQRTARNKCWWRQGETSPHTADGLYDGAATVENSLMVSQIVKYRVTIGPSNLSPRYKPTEQKMCPTKPCTSMSIAASLVNGPQIRTQIPTNL